ncbi:hypothetical protein LL06_25615, partial [Hoeflea sp. BAL378]
MLRAEADSGSERLDSVWQDARREKEGGGTMQGMEPEPAWLAVRIAGAVAGALVSLAYMMPKSAREAA